MQTLYTQDEISAVEASLLGVDGITTILLDSVVYCLSGYTDRHFTPGQLGRVRTALVLSGHDMITIEFIDRIMDTLKGINVVRDYRDAEAPAYEDKRTPDPVEPRYDREVQITIVARGFYKVWLLSRGSRYALWVTYRPGYDNGGNNYSSPQWLIAEAKESRFAMKTFPCYYTPEKKTYSGAIFTPDLFEFIESQLATRPTPYARWDSYGRDWYTK